MVLANNIQKASAIPAASTVRSSETGMGTKRKYSTKGVHKGSTEPVHRSARQQTAASGSLVVVRKDEPSSSSPDAGDPEEEEVLLRGLKEEVSRNNQAVLSVRRQMERMRQMLLEMQDTGLDDNALRVSASIDVELQRLRGSLRSRLGSDGAQESNLAEDEGTMDEEKRSRSVISADREAHNEKNSQVADVEKEESPSLQDMLLERIKNTDAIKPRARSSASLRGLVGTMSLADRPPSRSKKDSGRRQNSSSGRTDEEFPTWSFAPTAVGGECIGDLLLHHQLGILSDTRDIMQRMEDRVVEENVDMDDDMLTASDDCAPDKEDPFPLPSMRNAGELKKVLSYNNSSVSRRHNGPHHWLESDSDEVWTDESDGEEENDHRIVTLFARELLRKQEAELETQLTNELIRSSELRDAKIAVAMRSESLLNCAMNNYQNAISPTCSFSANDSEDSLTVPMSRLDDTYDDIEAAGLDKKEGEMDDERVEENKVAREPSNTFSRPAPQPLHESHSEISKTARELRLEMQLELQRQQQIFDCAIELSNLDCHQHRSFATEAIGIISNQAQVESVEMHHQIEQLVSQQAYESSVAAIQATTEREMLSRAQLTVMQERELYLERQRIQEDSHRHYQLSREAALTLEHAAELARIEEMAASLPPPPHVSYPPAARAGESASVSAQEITLPRESIPTSAELSSGPKIHEVSSRSLLTPGSQSRIESLESLLATSLARIEALEAQSKADKATYKRMYDISLTSMRDTAEKELSSYVLPHRSNDYEELRMPRLRQLPSDKEEKFLFGSLPRRRDLTTLSGQRVTFSSSPEVFDVVEMEDSVNRDDDAVEVCVTTELVETGGSKSTSSPLEYGTANDTAVTGLCDEQENEELDSAPAKAPQQQEAEPVLQMAASCQSPIPFELDADTKAAPTTTPFPSEPVWNIGISIREPTLETLPLKSAFTVPVRVDLEDATEGQEVEFEPASEEHMYIVEDDVVVSRLDDSRKEEEDIVFAPESPARWREASSELRSISRGHSLSLSADSGDTERIVAARSNLELESASDVDPRTISPAYTTRSDESDGSITVPMVQVDEIEEDLDETFTKTGKVSSTAAANLGQGKDVLAYSKPQLDTSEDDMEGVGFKIEEVKGKGSDSASDLTSERSSALHVHEGEDNARNQNSLEPFKILSVSESLWDVVSVTDDVVVSGESDHSSSQNTIDTPAPIRSLLSSLSNLPSLGKIATPVHAVETDGNEDLYDFGPPILLSSVRETSGREVQLYSSAQYYEKDAQHAQVKSTL